MSLEFASHDWQAWEEEEKAKIIEQIASSIPPDIFSTYKDRDALDKVLRQVVLARSDLVAPHEVDEIVSSLMGQATGYGVLQEFFLPGAEEITEVFINPSPDGVPKILYSKHGKPWPTEKVYFQSNDEVLRYLQKICDDAGRPLTMENPIVDAWLKDGTRVAVVAFGASPFGPSATFRKSPTTRPPMPLEKLVELGMMPKFVADMLVDLLVSGHANIGIFGRTDSGKTTLLRALGLFIMMLERTFIAETSFELFLPNLKNVVNLVEVAVGNRIIVDMTNLVKTMNRNNPDRAILSEIRAKEIIAASGMASSTSGGFWTTGHAGNIHTLRTRIWGMFMDGGINLPIDFLDEIISSMFHFLIFVDKVAVGEESKRTLTEVVEVVPGQGYRTIIRFDRPEYVVSGGKTRLWIYENTVTLEMLAQLASYGARLKPEYQEVKQKLLQ